MDETKLQALQSLISYVQKNKIVPNTRQLKEFDSNITPKLIEYHFGNYSGMVKEAHKYAKDVFDSIFTESDFNELAWARVKKTVNTNNKFIVISAVCGAEIDEDALKSVKTYSKKTGAAILLIPIKSGGHGFQQLHHKLKDKAISVVFREIHLNENIKIVPISLSTTASKPHSGLNRVGKRSCSLILGATKLSKETVPTANYKFPHQIITTGVITKPNYIKGLEVKKADYIANEEHKQAAIIVELANNRIYFQREVEFDVDGSFVDVGLNGVTRYLPNGTTKKEVAEALSVGDSHFPFEVDPVADLKFREVAKKLSAKHVFLHDIYSFSGRSHHDAHNELIIIRKAEAGYLDLENELKLTAKHLLEWSKLKTKIHIVPSNHNEHLDKYLATGMHRQDPHNARIAMSMIIASLDGVIPLKHGLDTVAKMKANNVLFHSRDASFKIQECEMLFHGDRGGDGARGSLANLHLSLGNCIIGHSHKPGIHGDTWQNGTSTYTDVENRPDYTKGAPSSWLQTSTVVTKGKGDRCLRSQITVIDGAWCLEDWLKNKSKKRGAA